MSTLRKRLNQLGRPRPPTAVPHFRIALLDVSLRAPIDDVMDVAVMLDGAKVLRAAVARVGAQMLASPKWRGLALDDDGGEQLVKPLAIMDVGPGHDERQRDVTAVHQEVALAAFFPRSVGLGPAASYASGAFIIAPSTLCQRQAMPASGRTRQVQLSTECCGQSRIGPLAGIVLTHRRALEILAGTELRSDEMGQCNVGIWARNAPAPTGLGASRRA